MINHDGSMHALSVSYIDHLCSRDYLGARGKNAIRNILKYAGDRTFQHSVELALAAELNPFAFCAVIEGLREATHEATSEGNWRVEHSEYTEDPEPESIPDSRIDNAEAEAEELAYEDSWSDRAALFV